MRRCSLRNLLFISFATAAFSATVALAEPPESIDRAETAKKLHYFGAGMGTAGWAMPILLAGGNPVWAPLLPGFGIGQAIQGRYGERGWIFTAGEVGAIAFGVAIAVAACGDSRAQCQTEGIAIPLLIAYLPFRIWEVVDLWSGSEKEAQPAPGLSFYLAPTSTRALASGISYRF